MFAVTVSVRTFPELLVNAVTVPALGLVHAGAVLSTKTAVPEIVVIVSVSATSAAPVPVGLSSSTVNVNLMFVGVRPCTSSFDVAAEVNVAALGLRVV